jgi:HSP20 family protein
MAMDRRRYSAGYMPLRDAIDQLFEGSFITPQSLGPQGNFPPVDMHLTEDDVVIEIAVPGINPDDINISVTGDTVTLSGEIKREAPNQKHQHVLDEIWRGRFQRSFQMPIQVDANKADASFQNGVLTLRLPKAEATKPRKIQVRQQHSTIQQSEGEPSSSGIETEKISVQGGK